MTADKHGRSTSPIHVHVEDNSPVHVHVKKPKRPAGRQTLENRVTDEKQAGFGSKSNLRRGGPNSRSKSPTGRKSRWIPPPANTSHPGSQKLSWQGPSHRLEMCSDDPAGDDTDEEEKNTTKMRKYEKKIDTLMTEVGTLRNEVELQKSSKELMRREEDLEDTERALAEKEAELDTYRQELDATEAQNRILKRSMDFLKEDSMLTRSERGRLNSEREVLMKKLVEVELDGQAAAKQVSALRDVIRRLREREERLEALEEEQNRLYESSSQFSNPLPHCTLNQSSSPVQPPSYPESMDLSIDQVYFPLHTKFSAQSMPRSEPPLKNIYDKWQINPRKVKKKTVNTHLKKSLKESRSEDVPASSSKTKLKQRARSVEAGIQVTNVSHPTGAMVRDIRKSSVTDSGPVLHQTLQIFTMDTKSAPGDVVSQKEEKKVTKKKSDQNVKPERKKSGDCIGEVLSGDDETKLPSQKSSSCSVKEQSEQLHRQTVCSSAKVQRCCANSSAIFCCEGNKRPLQQSSDIFPIAEERGTDVYPRDINKHRVRQHASDTSPRKTQSSTPQHNRIKLVASELRRNSRHWSDSHVSGQCTNQNAVTSTGSMSSLQNVKSFASVDSCTCQYNNNNKENGRPPENSPYRHTHSAPTRVVFPQPEQRYPDMGSFEEMSFDDTSGSQLRFQSQQESEESQSSGQRLRYHGPSQQQSEESQSSGQRLRYHGPSQQQSEESQSSGQRLGYHGPTEPEESQPSGQQIFQQCRHATSHSNGSLRPATPTSPQQQMYATHPGAQPNQQSTQQQPYVISRKPSPEQQHTNLFARPQTPPPPPPSTPRNSICPNPSEDNGRLYEQLSQRLNGVPQENSQENETLLQLQSFIHAQSQNRSLKRQSSHIHLETFSPHQIQASEHFSPQHHSYSYPSQKISPPQIQSSPLSVASSTAAPVRVSSPLHVSSQAPGVIHHHRSVSPMTSVVPSTPPSIPPSLPPSAAPQAPPVALPQTNRSMSMELLRLLTSQNLQKQSPAAENHIRLSNTVNMPPMVAAESTSPNYTPSPEKHLSSTDAAVLSKQKELLVERLADFEDTNRALRQLLRERHEDESANARLAEQRDVLLRKLKETEDRMLSLRTEIVEKDRLLAEARFQVDAQKHENSALSGIQGSLESTRGHLQKQLRQKEADCNRMAVQIRSLESQLAQERIENDHLQQLLATAKQKSDQDKEALKKATRVQKQRASRSEDAVEQLQAQLMDRDQRTADVTMDLDALRSRLDKISKEKAQSYAENTALKTRLTELEAILERVEDDGKVTLESATVRIQEKTAEASTYRKDNERLKSSLVSAEDKVLSAEDELAQLRAKLRQSEALVDEYRGQMNKSRREADETILQLEEQKRETGRVAHEGESEMDKVKSRLQSRLAELEPIPALLQSTEMRLADTSERLQLAERRHADNTRLIAELTAKCEMVNVNWNNNEEHLYRLMVESQGQQLGSYREKVTKTTDTNRSLDAKLDAMEKKLRDIEDQNRDLLHTVSKREESIHQVTVRLDERGHENASLQRQLEAALAEARRLSDSSRDKAACKDRTWQQRFMEMETQLSTARTENARLKREKEEAERKFNSRMYDLRDRLEQSHASNRSLQTYVHFLKTSYAHVFDEKAAAAAYAQAYGSSTSGIGGASNLGAAGHSYFTGI